MKIEKNEGTLDREIRLGVGILFLLLGGLVFKGLWIFLSLLVAGILLVTAATGFCPVYKLLGWKTN